MCVRQTEGETNRERGKEGKREREKDRKREEKNDELSRVRRWIGKDRKREGVK